MPFIYHQTLFMYSPQRVTGPRLEPDNCSTIHFHTVLLHVVTLVTLASEGAGGRCTQCLCFNRAGTKGGE
jgi:hypothetical protein